ncbi:MAG: MFS transporter [Chloroflexi bacterium]|nr:MFS transporter [Chloroflexota bacterium]
MFTKAKTVFNEYPHTFWTLTGTVFIDSLGGALLFPFFALYVTQKFGVGMTEVGVLFAILSGARIVGSFLSGALTDKIGRRSLMIYGLIFSASSSLLMAFIEDLGIFYIAVVFVGLLSSLGGPAQQAMIADILPEKQRADGYGLIHVSDNMAHTIGPMIGGLLAGISYLLLFWVDAILSVITALIIYFSLPESKPQKSDKQTEESMGKILSGYWRVAQNGVFMAFFGIAILMKLVYRQMGTTLSIFLCDVHSVPPQGYGWLLSLNAAMVVLFQFMITRKTSKHKPMKVMAIGTFLYAIGFAMYGFVSTMLFFFVAMAIITIGEMFISPIGQSIVARFSPEDMRGRYMAFYSFSWTISSLFGPLLAGLVMDNYDPNLVWYLAGVIGLIAAFGYWQLNSGQ